MFVIVWQVQFNGCKASGRKSQADVELVESNTLIYNNHSNNCFRFTNLQN